MKKLVTAALLALCLTPSTALGEDVTVILDYVANTNHTGMYVALDQGYYADAGLNVTIIEPTEGATNTLIAVGKGEFGISYQEDVTMALSSADPLPIRAIAAIIQHNTSGFATYAGKGITSPADFEGKTYAGWGGPGEEAVLKAVMKRAGADFSALNMVISDGSGFAALKDKADIMWFFEGWDNVKCQLADFPIDYMELRQLDPRLDYYTPVIITSERMIAERPETVRAFLAATSLGYAYAEENPEESAKILQKYAPDYDLEMLTISQTYLSAKYSEDAPRWGEMKDEVWDHYTDLLVEYGVIGEAIPAAQCYTNEFLPEAAQ
ncbi:MAG: ABC transporter substrate-binding protein [Clostridia bacterium]|nr:ABC transporter substrate-binding protein [Clostridia bacterium]